ncbi:hypothetical protein EIP91_005628 [Steccherinum ochraceum]|uniref:HMG box domain-containing protein n=1 Tax=Steccherinum ochraceum TaxID=92696 RepID=A0A4R0R9S7_9APHY|nr:hypothetical protein EIP91_005628 [Steccherinum ochraceum]
MALTFVQDPVLNEMDDDDGMPPLVDNPYPSMTFTFSAEMSPITYSTDPTRFEVLPDVQPEQAATFSPPTSPALGPTRVTHSKKRDASYIPRPPNAFILFRSSFIRAEHIPGKIEGNHSALSKIIGKYWKSLPREEKEVWEAKALVAQAEHRQKYPDWRFRPAANALAKVKDGPKKRTRKGRGEAEKEERSREKRCSKIAEMLVAGKKGAALEVAIEQYDCEHVEAPAIKREGSGVVLVQYQPNLDGAVETKDATDVLVQPAPSAPSQAAPPDTITRKQSRSLSPEAAHDIRFETPLTSMFKRSSSAPASYTRTGPVTEGSTMTSSARQDFTFPNPVQPADTCAATFLVDAHEGEPRVVGDITGMSSDSTRLLDVKEHASVQSLPESASAVASFSPSGGNVSQSLWSQTYRTTYSDIDTYSPSIQSFDSDLEDGASPVHSPLAYTWDIAGDGDTASAGSMPFVSPAIHQLGSGGTGYRNPQSSYSSLNGWADDAVLKRTAGDYSSVPTFLSAGQTPMVYDPDRVMRDAFEAASTAPYEDWGVAFTSSDSYRLSSVRDIQSLQMYAQGWQDIARRQDDGRQLF